MKDQWRQPLSDASLEVLCSGADGAYRRLVVPRPPTGAGADALRRKLSALTPQTVLRSPATSTDAAQALIAGLWLWHDFLDESHTISQGLSDATGSFWHAIMHRREGDFSNAKYWSARCRQHPVRREIGDADALVDLVERVHEQSDDPAHVRALAAQRAEWEALFGHCLMAAGGTRG